MNFSRNFKEFDAEIHGHNGASAWALAGAKKMRAAGPVGLRISGVFA